VFQLRAMSRFAYLRHAKSSTPVFCHRSSSGRLPWAEVPGCGCMSEQAVSRVLFPPHRAGDNDHSSSPGVTTGIKRPTRELGRTTLGAPLFGLAPGGVCLAPAVTGGTGELLPHRFTLTPADCPPRRFAFCGTFLPVARTGSYPAPCPVEPGLSSPLHEAKQRSFVLL